MTATLEQIHHDPAILDRAIAQQERLQIWADGKVKATLVPEEAETPGAIEEARRIMRERFANPDWEFAVGEMPSREERNARR